MIDVALAGGFCAGALAGWAARYGRLCTMSAIEDALVAGDARGARAWAIALAVAVAATHVGERTGLITLAGAVHVAPRLHLPGLVLGGLLFGIGMTLVGTCSFGLLVRAGSGDLRAAVSSVVVGIVAMAATAGLLAPTRVALLDVGVVDLSDVGGVRIDAIVRQFAGETAAIVLVLAVVAAPLGPALVDARLRRRPRLMLGAAVMGLAVAVGWVATSRAVDGLSLSRPESLSFVAPTGRALLQLMMVPFRDIGFGVAAMAAVVAASFATSAWRGELRLEAFDDASEMVRHLVGGACMGAGGVLAQGCTIGQGLTASSILAIGAPIFLVSVVAGARIGLHYLLGGQALWRLGRS